MTLQKLADSRALGADRSPVTGHRVISYGRVTSAPRREARDMSFDGCHSQLHRVSLTANHTLVSKECRHAVDSGRVDEDAVDLARDRQDKTMPAKKAAQGSLEGASTHGLGAIAGLQNSTSKLTEPKAPCVQKGEPNG